MPSVRALNLGAAILALSCSAWLASPALQKKGEPTRTAPMPSASARVVTEHGREGLRDASGRFVPLGDYKRIASTSGVTDSVLLELVEPTRIASFTRFSAEDPLYGYRFAGKPALVDLSKLEAVVALHPDLVLVNSLGGSDRIERLRHAGLQVFDLGEMRGMRTLLSNISVIGRLVGRPTTADVLAQSLERRMQAIAGHIPEDQRPTGLYLSTYGDAIYGGGEGTNYHDVIVAAGLRDAATPRYPDWIRYTPEMLIALDPEIIVTHDGMTDALCKHPGLSQLRACGRDRTAGRIVEVSGALLDNPGLVMLDAAEAVFEAVHGSRRGAQLTP
jgi:iron complex transport system substrate-binding protein